MKLECDTYECNRTKNSHPVDACISHWEFYIVLTNFIYAFIVYVKWLLQILSTEAIWLSFLRRFCHIMGSWFFFLLLNLWLFLNGAIREYGLIRSFFFYYFYWKKKKNCKTSKNSKICHRTIAQAMKIVSISGRSDLIID